MRQSLTDNLHHKILGKIRKAPAFDNIHPREYQSLKKHIRYGLQEMGEAQLLKLYSQILSKNILGLLTSKDKTASDKKVEKFLEHLLHFDKANSLSPALTASLIKNLFSSAQTTTKKKTPDVENVSTREKIQHSWKEEPSQVKPSRTEPNESYFDMDFYRFGSNNKKRLNLDKYQVRLLNKVNIGYNSFTEIQQCADESALLYLWLIEKLKSLYEEHQLNFYQYLKELDDKAYDQFHMVYDSNWNSWSTPPSKEIYKALLKIAENGIRDVYGHKRKLDTDRSYYLLKQNLKLVTEIKFKHFFSEGLEKVNPPNEQTTIALNAINIARWRAEFKLIKAAGKELSSQDMHAKIKNLLKFNIRNKNLSEIYFEVAKLWVGKNSIEAIRAYIHHYQLSIDNGLKSPKTFPKTSHKKLFKKEEQLQSFIALINTLSRFKNPAPALQAVPEIFVIKRKEIVLDEKSISKINAHHSETVEKLNEILEETAVEQTMVPTENTPSISIPRDKSEDNLKGEPENILKDEPVDEPTMDHALSTLDDLFGGSSPIEDFSDLNLEPYHLELLQQLLANGNFIAHEDITALARKHRVFKGRLINQLNEKFYSIAEDNLIEETPEGYQLIDDYIKEAKLILDHVIKN